MTAWTLRRASWGLAAALLVLPAIAMVLEPVGGWGFNWGPGDFAAAALLLGSAGLSLELAARLPRRLRLPAAAGVTAALLLMWAELAVGLF